MYWLAWVFIAVFFGVTYRLGYKLLSGHMTPLFNVSIVTLVACVVCFSLYLWREHGQATLDDLSLKTAVLLVFVGFALAGLEVSIMMIYKSGGPLSIAQSLGSSMVGVVVFAIGLVFFKDQLNWGQILGFVLGLSGITLMTYYSRAK